LMTDYYQQMPPLAVAVLPATSARNTSALCCHNLM
jgi:hypothetical protein